MEPYIGGHLSICVDFAGISKDSNEFHNIQKTIKKLTNTHKTSQKSTQIQTEAHTIHTDFTLTAKCMTIFDLKIILKKTKDGKSLQGRL